MLESTLRAVLTTLLALATFVGPAAAQEGETARVSVPPERIEALRTRLGKVCDELGLPGLAVAVVVDDRVVVAEGFGQRDLEAKLPVDADTRFMIGSTTKAFTSALIATLVDAGVLHWDDRVASLLPGFLMFDNEATAGCTLRDLLSHRSGLMRTDMTWYAGTADFPALLAAFGSAEPTGKFRSVWQYNNNGFLMAGVAAATKEAKRTAPASTADWGDLLRTRLLVPLGMGRTTPRHADALADADRAIGYEHVPGDEPNRAGADGPVKPRLRRARLRDLTNIAPAGAIWSTARDMSLWLRFQLGRGKLGDRRIVSQERVEEMWQPQIGIGPRRDPEIAQGDGGAAYGMGWMVSKRRGTRLIAHDGGIDGFTTNVAMLPDLGIGYAAMTNLGGASIAAAMPGIVFGTLLGENDGQPAAPTEDFAAFLGKYRADMLHSEFTVLVKDGKLAIDVPGQTVYELRPPDADGKRTFALTDEISVKFERDAAGQVNRMRMYQMGLEFELPKLGVTFVPEVTDAELADLGGLFHDPRLAKNVSIQRTPEGRLAMDVPGQMVFELKRGEEKDRWDFRLIPRTWMVFTRNNDGKVVGATMFQNGTSAELPRVAEPALADGATTAAALEELLRRHDAAHGFDSLRKAGDVRATGTASFVNQGVSGRFTTLVRGAERRAQRLDFPPYGWIRSAIRRDAGSVAGEIDSAFDGWREASAKEMALEQLVRWLPLPTLDRDSLKSVELVGYEGAGDVRLAKLRLVATNGAEAILLVDDKTGLAKRLDGSTEIPGAGAVPLSIAFDDYRDVAGMKIPFRIVTDNAVVGRLIQTVESVEPGATIPESEWRIAKP